MFTKYEITFKVPQHNRNLLHYSTPSTSGVRITGLGFSSSLLPLANVPGSFISLDTYQMDNFTFVTGSDSTHFIESLGAIAGFQSAFPKHTIVYYDLGLLEDQVQQVC